MAMEFFCPVCDSPMATLPTILVVANPYTRVVAMGHSDALVCPSCPVALDVDWGTGAVRAVPGLHLRDLTTYPVMMRNQPFRYRSTVTSLHGRKDS